MSGKLKDIVSYAEENGNKIGLETLIDILKDDNSKIAAEDMESIIESVRGKGISVNTYSDEDYPDAPDPSERFTPADVNITNNVFNVYNVMERLENDEIDLSPGYQRKADLWSERDQCRLIESLMLKIPIPAFYFDATSDEIWRVIDGLQRLSAFKNYLVGVDGQKKKLSGLQYLTEFNDKTFDELPRQYSRRIKETQINVYLVEKGTPDAVIYNIFRRINTGALVLSPQEIRQALYQGKATKLIAEMAEYDAFLEATDYKINTERMLDREYINRYLAFTELDIKKDYRGSIDNFLIKALKQINQYPDDRIEDIKNRFIECMRVAKNVYGKYAFRKFVVNGRRGPVNKALFELWAVTFTKELNPQMVISIQNKKEVFLKKVEELLGNSTFQMCLKGGDSYSVEKRIDMFNALLEDFYD